jgi:hypothetical protein
MISLVDFKDEFSLLWTVYLSFVSCLETWIQEALSRSPGDRPSAARIESRFGMSINREMSGVAEDN